MSIEVIRAALTDARSAVDVLLHNDETLRAIDAAAKVICDSLKKGGCVYSCGNGGSLCDAMHFAEEMTGRYRKNRPAYAAVAISDQSHMACVANDFGYDQVFSRYVEGVCRKGDVFVGISTSGRSANIIKAAKAAKQKGMTVICLTGVYGSEITKCSDISIVTPFGKWADRVQEMHIKCIHILIELIERELNPENYAD